MQIALMLIFVVIWLLIFWLASIALEATGMERTKARFQCLSAITGTGFTTREAESIVEHPKRRRIATWLIFIGNVGIIAFIILLILGIRAGLTAPSPLQISIIAIVVIAIALFIKFRIIDKLTNAIVRLMRKGRPESYLLTEEILHQTGHYGVARIALSEKAKITGLMLKDTGFEEHGIMILAIERKDTALPLPKTEERLLAGDYLLCYGRVAEIISLTR